MNIIFENLIKIPAPHALHRWSGKLLSRFPVPDDELSSI